MKKSILVAVLNFAAVVAVFALLDLLYVRGNTAAWVETFTRPVHLALTGGFALVESVLAFFQSGRLAAA